MLTFCIYLIFLLLILQGKICGVEYINRIDAFISLSCFYDHYIFPVSLRTLWAKTDAYGPD